MSDLADLEAKLLENEELIAELDEILALDPSNDETLAMKSDCQATVASLKKQIASQKRNVTNPPQLSANPPPPPPPGDIPPPPPRYEVNSDAPPPPSDSARASFNTGDSIMAKWSEDKQWYAAVIISKTGSNADPIYTVKFTNYGNKETKRSHEVRAVENKKRKADTLVPPPPPPTSANPKPISTGSVISAAPSVDPSLIKKREPSKVSDGPTRMAPAPKKLKGNKALDRAKTSWNDWQKNGPKKTSGMGPTKINKESQFRTNDSVNARVGFTNSGRPMQKDQARKKWTYDKVEEQDDDD